MLELGRKEKKEKEKEKGKRKGKEKGRKEMNKSATSKASPMVVCLLSMASAEKESSKVASCIKTSQSFPISINEAQGRVSPE